MYVRFFKRLIDFAVSLVLLLILSPIILGLTLLLFIVNKGYPFFVQERPGKDEKIFRMIKFRSMNNKKDEEGNLLPYEDRITRVGALIRKLSLDELPQLINVLKGDMSLIGPRPLLVKYLDLYNNYQKQRHKVKPGITGWAQVNGRNSLTWDEKFDLDIWYVNNVSFSNDLKILEITIEKVVKGKDVNSGENINMPEFRGN